MTASLAALPGAGAAAPQPVIATTRMASAHAGLAYSFKLKTTTPSRPGKWQILSGDTDGLTLEPKTGVMSGVPVAVGTFILRVRFTDAKGAGRVTDRVQLDVGPVTPYGIYSRLTTGDDTSDIPEISANGAWVAFASVASDLGGPTNAAGGWVYRVHTGSEQVRPVAPGTAPDISADGRLIAFVSWSRHLVSHDPDGTQEDVFIWRKGHSGFQLVPRSRGALSVSVSDDGRYVAYDTRARLVKADRDKRPDVYVYDRKKRTTTFVNAGADRRAETPVLSGNGRWLTYAVARSAAPGVGDVVLRDLRTGRSQKITDGSVLASDPALSADGGVVAYYVSDYSGPDYAYDVRVYTAASGSTVSVPSGYVDLGGEPTVSGDGSVVAFAGVVSGQSQVLSWSPGAADVTQLTDGNYGSEEPSLSGNGQRIAFTSYATDLVPGRTGRPSGSYASPDVFLWEPSPAST
ncbi:TolB family protein [Nocardioides sp.]|uniref:TolB family protein n=1 Tax=Nocardioides sp. TaxID=35761 RepID=UPI00352894D7